MRHPSLLPDLFRKHFADLLALLSEVFDKPLDTAEDLLTGFDVAGDAVPDLPGAFDIFKQNSSGADGGGSDPCLAFAGGEQDGSCYERTGGEATRPRKIDTFELIGDGLRSIRGQLSYGH